MIRFCVDLHGPYSGNSTQKRITRYAWGGRGWRRYGLSGDSRDAGSSGGTGASAAGSAVPGPTTPGTCRVTQKPGVAARAGRAALGEPGRGHVLPALVLPSLGVVRPGPANPRGARRPPPLPAVTGGGRYRACGLRRGSTAVVPARAERGTPLGRLATGRRLLPHALRRDHPAAGRRRRHIPRRRCAGYSLYQIFGGWRTAAGAVR
jgi:hypothetical protein